MKEDRCKEKNGHIVECELDTRDTEVSIFYNELFQKRVLYINRFQSYKNTKIMS